LAAPVERHQVIFLNPDLAGLFTAYLSHRAGARIAVVDESDRHKSSDGNFPIPFPAGGTFHPQDVNLIATDAGFPPPVWQRLPILRICVTDWNVRLDSDDGPGGLLIALRDICPHGRSIWTEWLQNHFKTAGDILKRQNRPRMGRFRRIETSVADEILNLGIEEPDPLLLFLDILSILVVGRGVVQLDARDLPIVLAGYLTGWHMPSSEKRDWREILKNRLRKEGARWHEIEKVESIQLFSKRLNVVRCSNGSLQAGQIIVVPQSDRFSHPAIQGMSTAIKWKNWYGRVIEKPHKYPVVGVIRASDKRPPVNDNFITFHLRPAMDGLYTVSAPIEDRYVASDMTRFYEIITRSKVLLRYHLGWDVEDLSSQITRSANPQIALPGTAPSVSFPEGPLWGDDILSRLKAADRLSRRLVERLK